MSRPLPFAECDLAVVGAGIVGLAVARELGLRHPGARIQVLERERAVGTHQTGHNSGVIHQGVYYRPGSLKARLCREGADALYRYCDEHGIDAQPLGKLVVAVDEDELERLDELERRSRANGVPEVARVDGDRIPDIEPHVRGVAALYSPRTGAVDYGAVTRSLRQDVIVAGGRVSTGCGVVSVRPHNGGLRLHHAAGGDDGAVRRVLRRRLVGPAGAHVRRRRRPADRAVPGRLPDAAAGGAASRAGHGVPGARSRAAVPRRASHPACGRRGGDRAVGAAGRRPRRVPAADDPPGRRRPDGDLAGHAADGPPVLADRADRGAPRRLRGGRTWPPRPGWCRS